MDLDDTIKGIVAALLNDQVDAKSGLAAKVGLVGLVIAVGLVVVTEGWLRGLSIVLLLLVLAFLAFVWLSRRLAKGVVNRIAPPLDLAETRARFESALAEADLPDGPVSFLRLVWRLRKGIGPEVERLAGVVQRLQSDLG